MFVNFELPTICIGLSNGEITGYHDNHKGYPTPSNEDGTTPKKKCSHMLYNIIYNITCISLISGGTTGQVGQVFT